MPKVISAEERELIKQALQRAASSLIRTKGLRNITVDDMVKAAGIAKGSFYSYYKSKEELLYEVFSNGAQKMFDLVLGFRPENADFKSAVEQALHEIYLTPDSIALYIRPEDFEYMKRKFPDKIQNMDNTRTQKNLSQISGFFGLTEIDGGTLAYLMDGLQHIASCASDYGRASRQQSLDIFVRAIADFIDEKAAKNGGCD
jgi:AcrR family transcriptional regulator